MKMTYQPKKRQRKKEHGFRKRMKTKNGRNVLKEEEKFYQHRDRRRGLFVMVGNVMLKRDILRRKEDFDLIYKKGRSVGERYIVLFYMKNGLSYNRIAFLASKKVGNSVKRNRAKRLMKESYRFLKDDIGNGYDIIFIARNTINGKKLRDVEKSMANSLSKSKLYQR